MDDDLIVTSSVRVPRSELRFSFSASGGPGGQHANRSNTRVELRFDVASSSAFGPGQRRRVLDRLGSEVRVVVDDERSQSRNRTLAEERLVARLRSALHVEAPRRKTKPTKGSQRRRVDAKKRRGQTKQMRRKPTRDD